MARMLPQVDQTSQSGCFLNPSRTRAAPCAIFYTVSQAITVDKWLHFRAARRAATLVKYLRVHMERLLLRKITHPQEDVSDNGRDLIQVRRNINTRVAACPTDRENEPRQTISMAIFLFPGHVRKYMLKNSQQRPPAGDTNINIPQSGVFKSVEFLLVTGAY